MERDINNAEYLEWGEFNENLYGTKLDSIKQVIQAGKMCVIDCSVKSLKLIANQEFMPYVVFVKCPSSIDDLYNMKLKARSASKLNRNVGYHSACTAFDSTRPVFVSFKQIINQSILNINDQDIGAVLEESEAIENDYHAYFDAIIVNDDMNKCFAR
jgi:guanylate kinase